MYLCTHTAVLSSLCRLNGVCEAKQKKKAEDCFTAALYCSQIQPDTFMYAVPSEEASIIIK